MPSLFWLQVVVLARIIPDEEQAISSATGIKLLVDLLRDSASDQIVAMSCDCIARLSHTRAGMYGVAIWRKRAAFSVYQR